MVILKLTYIHIYYFYFTITFLKRPGKSKYYRVVVSFSFSEIRRSIVFAECHSSNFVMRFLHLIFLNFLIFFMPFCSILYSSTTTKYIYVYILLIYLIHTYPSLGEIQEIAGKTLYNLTAYFRPL